MAALKFYWANDLTGGGTGALDKIPTANWLDKYGALVVKSNYLYAYECDDDLGGTESSPWLITPDDESGNKRLNLLGAVFEDVKTKIAKLYDTNQSNVLSLIWNEGATSDYTLNLAVGGASRTLTLNENFTIGNGTNITITGVTAARTLTLNENFTIGGGYDGTLTYSGSGKTLTVEDTTNVNQDLTTDASPTFAGLTITDELDGHTLQIDGINSDGGAFSFTTSGQVTFNQNVRLAALGIGTDPTNPLHIYEAIENSGSTGSYIKHDIDITENGSYSTTGMYYLGYINPGGDQAADNGGSHIGLRATMQLRENAGTLNNLTGLYFDYGSYGPGGADVSATLTTVTGARLHCWKRASTSITTSYGLWLSGAAGATSYGIYEDISAGTINYFSGKIGVGAVSPAAKAHIDQTSTTAAIPVLILDQGDISEQCIKFSSDSVDRDINLFTIDVTGTPTLMWDESEDGLGLNKGLRIDGKTGIGLAPVTESQLKVLAADAQTTIYRAIYGQTLSDATNNYGVTGIAQGGGATNNYGVYAQANNADTLNHHFRDTAGNYSDATGWHDVSDPKMKEDIKVVSKKDKEVFYAALDKLHLKGYKLKAELKEKNWKAPRRFGLLANDPDLPSWLSTKGGGGISAGQIATYLIGIAQYQKEIIIGLEKRLAILEK